MLAMPVRRPRYQTRLYLFEGGWPTARIPLPLFKQLVAGVPLKRFAATSQLVLEVTIGPSGKTEKFVGSIYRFDDNGILDIGAIAAGAEGLAQEPVKARGAVTDISGLLNARRWRHENFWTPSSQAVSEVIADIDDQENDKPSRYQAVEI